VGGVGKATLAVPAARRLHGWFPDGQLFAILRGGSARPQCPSEVLAQFLRDLGVPGSAIPVGLEERAVRYRSLLPGSATSASSERSRHRHLPRTAGQAGLAGLGSKNRMSKTEEGHMQPYDQKILVLGATGNQGGAAARHLLEVGFTQVHALVRGVDSGQAKELASSGVKLEVGNLDDSGSLRTAMTDAYGAFCVLPLDRQGPEAEIRRGRIVADVAMRAGVEHFVYSSSGGADRSDGVPHFATKYAIEQHVRSLRLPATIVRPALFMENFLDFERPRVVDGVSVFRSAFYPGTRRQMIAVDDIGIVVADLFARPADTIGTTLEIAGDELTGPQVAEAYARATGRPARFEEQPIEEVRAFDPGFAAMFDWLNTHSFGADITALRGTYPELSTFATWLDGHLSAFEG
jgi:uncharacterized protein YbjT (DUF2867 family)